LAGDWEGMTRSQRVEFCALMAAEAQRLARAALPALAEGYLALAQQWLELALELTRHGD